MIGDSFDSTTESAAKGLLRSLDQIHLVAIPADGGAPTGKDFGMDANAATKWATAQNVRKRNVYWTVNRCTDGVNRKPSKSDIVEARFLHADFDPPSEGEWNKDALVGRLQDSPFPPSTIIFSGNGIQAFWRLAPGPYDMAKVEAVNRMIAKVYGGDACHNIDRLMRLPGFTNWPNAKKRIAGRVPAMATVIQLDNGRLLTVGDLEQWSDPEQVEATPAIEQIAATKNVTAEILYSADDLGLETFDELRSLIDHPSGNDRSKDALACTALMLRRGHNEAQILGVLLNPTNAVSAHALAQRDPRRAAVRCIDNAGGRVLHNAKSGQAILTRVSDVESKHITWLWLGRFALGKLGILAGHLGLGKSQFTAMLAATVSIGGLWPNGEGNAPLGQVVMLSCEDDIADTIRPRLEAAGADLTKIHVLEAIVEKQGGRRVFSLKKDIEHMRQVLDLLEDVALVVIDPVTAYLDGSDSHNTAEVRAALAPLQDLAMERNFALVVVSHLNKSGGGGQAINAVTGSGAFVAASRSSFLIAADQDDSDRRLFLSIKNNLASPPGLAFRIGTKTVSNEIEAPLLVFDSGTVDISADEALDGSSSEDAAAQLRRAGRTSSSGDQYDGLKSTVLAASQSEGSPTVSASTFTSAKLVKWPVIERSKSTFEYWLRTTTRPQFEYAFANLATPSPVVRLPPVSMWMRSKSTTRISMSSRQTEDSASNFFFSGSSAETLRSTSSCIAASGSSKRSTE